MSGRDLSARHYYCRSGNESLICANLVIYNLLKSKLMQIGLKVCFDLLLLLLLVLLFLLDFQNRGDGVDLLGEGDSDTVGGLRVFHLAVSQ